MFEDIVKEKTEYFNKLEKETKKIKEEKWDRKEAIKRIIKYANSLDW